MLSWTTVPGSGSSMKVISLKTMHSGFIERISARATHWIRPFLRFFGERYLYFSSPFHQESYSRTFGFLKEEDRDFLGQKPDLLLRFCPQTESHDSGIRHLWSFDTLKLWRVTSIHASYYYPPFRCLRSPYMWRASIIYYCRFYILSLWIPSCIVKFTSSSAGIPSDNCNLLSQILSFLFKLYSPLFKFSWISRTLNKSKFWYLTSLQGAEYFHSIFLI